MLAAVTRRRNALGRRLPSPLQGAQQLVLSQFINPNDVLHGKYNLGTAGPLLNEQSGSSPSNNTNDYTFVLERGLYLPGVGGNSASTPDAAALDLEVDIEMITYAAPVDWGATDHVYFQSKWNGIGGQQSYLFGLKIGTGALRFLQSANGTATTEFLSTVTPGFANGTGHWVKVTRVDATGDVNFYTSDDPFVSGDTSGITWTKLGDTVTGTSGNGMFNSGPGAPYWVGGFVGGPATGPFNGLIKRSIVKDGVDGTPVFDADFTKVAGGVTSFAEDSVNAATVTINQSGLNPARILDGPTDIFDGVDDYGETADNALMNPSATDSFEAFLAMRSYNFNTGSNQGLYGKKAGYDTQTGWALFNRDSTADTEMIIADGTATAADDDVSPPSVGALHVVGGRRDVAADEVEYATNGAASGTPQTDATTATLANSEPVRVGARGSAPALFAAMERFGNAFVNHFDQPAMSDAHFEAAQRQLALMTGRQLPA